MVGSGPVLPDEKADTLYEKTESQCNMQWQTVQLESMPLWIEIKYVELQFTKITNVQTSPKAVTEMWTGTFTQTFCLMSPYLLK